MWKFAIFLILGVWAVCPDKKSSFCKIVLSYFLTIIIRLISQWKKKNISPRPKKCKILHQMYWTPSNHFIKLISSPLCEFERPNWFILTCTGLSWDCKIWEAGIFLDITELLLLTENSLNDQIYYYISYLLVWPQLYCMMEILILTWVMGWIFSWHTSSISWMYGEKQHNITVWTSIAAKVGCLLKNTAVSLFLVYVLIIPSIYSVLYICISVSRKSNSKKNWHNTEWELLLGGTCNVPEVVQGGDNGRTPLLQEEQHHDGEGEVADPGPGDAAGDAVSSGPAAHSEH